MKTYIATFYSHFGALTFYKTLEKMEIKAKLMPVPRKLSSSCGTCVQFDSYRIVESLDLSEDLDSNEDLDLDENLDLNEDLEAIYLCENDVYICKTRASDS